jgi:tyrosinase
VNRRLFLSASTGAALAACSSGSSVFGPRVTPPPEFYTRLEVTEFSRDSALVQAYREGVAAMMAIADPRDERSWHYWHNAHHMSKGEPPAAMAAVWNQCKHHRVPYFYAWHRGFVYFFEQMVRTMSGNSKFALPYWDYYRHPELPAIFANEQLPDGTRNALYWSDRVGRRIDYLSFECYQSLTFPNTRIKSFENLLEINPHGHVHDQIGGSMGHIKTSALDPIFWVHHCNVDRLWSAWLDAGDGRHMPPPHSSYYEPTFTYNLAKTWNLNVGAMVDTIPLGYTFSDLSLPQPTPGAALPQRPATVSSLHALGLEPVSVEVSVTASAAHRTYPELVLDGVELTPLGARGGFAIRIYAGLPDGRVPISNEGEYSAGEFGPFEISAAQMAMGGSMPAQGPVQLRYPLPPQALRSGAVAISFVAGGEPQGVSPGAALVQIGAISISG